MVKLNLKYGLIFCTVKISYKGKCMFIKDRGHCYFLLKKDCISVKKHSKRKK